MYAVNKQHQKQQHLKCHLNEKKSKIKSAKQASHEQIPKLKKNKKMLNGCLNTLTSYRVCTRLFYALALYYYLHVRIFNGVNKKCEGKKNYSLENANLFSSLSPRFTCKNCIFLVLSPSNQN